MRKRLVVNLLAGVAVAAMLMGCGGGGNENAESAADAEEQTADIDESDSTDDIETDDASAAYEPDKFNVSDVYTLPEQTTSIDITGCDTFTQMVDRKLDAGMGYANVRIGDDDVLMVSSGTYKWDDTHAAIDSDIFYYNDEGPEYMATVMAGGTAYPLAVKNGMLYVGGNHYMIKYTIETGKLLVSEEAYVKYDTDGNDTYYYRVGDGKFEDTDMDTAEEKFGVLFAELEDAEIIDFQSVGGDASYEGELPAYEYPGPELFYSVLYEYLTDELSKDYDKAAVSIPCPVIVEEDESDKSDIKVYGNFWIFNYDLNGQILECVSGGSYPGCVHIKSTDEGYEVTSMDVVADGSDFDESAREIFGDAYDEFIKTGEDEKVREELRAQIISNYVFDNNLDITSYQDYGWEPVSLPEENIDSFYSILN